MHYLFKKYKSVLFNRIVFISISLAITPVRGETLRIDEAENVIPVVVDIPGDWIKGQVVKENGIIYTLRRGNAEIEIRSFVFDDVDMDYIIHAKAARMYAMYSYINILLEKDETDGKIRKQTIFWKIRYQNKTYYEKTLILQYQNNVAILSCLAPEDEYQHHRVVFENAILSLKYDIEGTNETDKDSGGGASDDKKNDDSTGNKELPDIKETIKEIVKDPRENLINKEDKLKKKELK